MKKLLALSILFATTATIHAESLEEKKFWKGQMDYINRGIDDGEKQCGVKFTFEFVEKAKLREEAEKNNNSPYGICDSIVQEVVSLCREGEEEKASVKAKIKGFQCGYAKPRKLDLSKGGIVKYMGNNEESNFSDWAKPWLMKKL
jgi:hypothetical protein